MWTQSSLILQPSPTGSSNAARRASDRSKDHADFCPASSNFPSSAAAYFTEQAAGADSLCVSAMIPMRHPAAHLQRDDGLKALLRSKAGRTPAPDALQGGGCVLLQICTIK